MKKILLMLLVGASIAGCGCKVNTFVVMTAVSHASHDKAMMHTATWYALCKASKQIDEQRRDGIHIPR